LTSSFLRVCRTAWSAELGHPERVGEAHPIRLRLGQFELGEDPQPVPPRTFQRPELTPLSEGGLPPITSTERVRRSSRTMPAGWPRPIRTGSDVPLLALHVPTCARMGCTPAQVAALSGRRACAGSASTQRKSGDIPPHIGHHERTAKTRKNVALQRVSGRAASGI